MRHPIKQIRPLSPELIVRPVSQSPAAAHDFTAHISQLFSRFLLSLSTSRGGTLDKAFTTDGIASAGSPLLSCCHSFTALRCGSGFEGIHTLSKLYGAEPIVAADHLQRELTIFNNLVTSPLQGVLSN